MSTRLDLSKLSLMDALDLAILIEMEACHRYQMFASQFGHSGGYDAVPTLKLLSGVVDIYMPDLKFTDPEPAQRYCLAEDYPERAMVAIKEMHRQVGPLRFGPDGVARRGVLLRHLVMPGGLSDSEEVLGWIAQELSPHTYVNVMDQYRPCGTIGAYEELQTTISPEHYREAVEYAEEIGLMRLDRRDLSSLLKRLGIST